MSKLPITSYTEKVINLFGLGQAFKLAHIPFLVENDVYGAIALEGSSGTGKTTMFKRLGMLNKAAGGGDAGIYSADKAKYEDFIGIPIPDSVTKEMVIFPMPNAIAGKEMVLIDEANRASYDNQEKYLSLIASRIIDGTDVSCKYLYIAMNPIMTEGKESYEGVQPLDKAFGERVIGLITMPAFNELKKEEQISIMTAGFNQVQWEPSESDVDLHKRFLSEARERYEEAKHLNLENVCEYIHKVQRDLFTHSQGAISIEARRAQFVLVNILSTYALNSIYSSKSSLEASTLEALHISFPHRLWEQPVNNKQLEAAHNASKHLLNIDKRKLQRTASNYDGLLEPLREIHDAIQKANSYEDFNKEAFSKLINQGIPNIELDPINHYAYAIAVEAGLNEAAFEVSGPGVEQDFIKVNEFDRIKRIAATITSSDHFKEAVKIGEYYNNNNKHPDGFSYPSYTVATIDSETKSVQNAFDRTIGVELGQYAHAIIMTLAEEVVSPTDYVDIVSKIMEAVKLTRVAGVQFSNKLLKK